MNKSQNKHIEVYNLFMSLFFYSIEFFCLLNILNMISSIISALTSFEKCHESIYFFLLPFKKKKNYLILLYSPKIPQKSFSNISYTFPRSR